jgi:hypothetical protein
LLFYDFIELVKVQINEPEPQKYVYIFIHGKGYIHTKL